MSFTATTFLIAKILQIYSIVQAFSKTITGYNIIINRREKETS